MDFLKTIYYSFIALLIVVGAILAISLLPLKGNIKLLSVLSGSMEPKIKTGSVIIIKPIDEYKMGDIVTFGETTPTTVPKTHRIIGTEIINGIQYYSTKGDANKNEDSGKIKSQDIKGKVLLSIPLVGYAVSFIQTRRGFLLLIIIPCILIIISEIFKIWNGFKKEEKPLSNNDEQNTQ